MSGWKLTIARNNNPTRGHQVGRAMSELEQTLLSSNGCWTNSRMTCQHPLHPLFLILKPDLPAPPPPPFLILKPVRTYPFQHRGDPEFPHISILSREKRFYHYRSICWQVKCLRHIAYSPFCWWSPQFSEIGGEGAKNL